MSVLWPGPWGGPQVRRPWHHCRLCRLEKPRPLQVQEVLCSHLSGQLFFQKSPAELTTVLGIQTRGLENNNRDPLRSE